MCVTTRLLVVYLLCNVLSNTQALRDFDDMNWTSNPADAWPSFGDNDDRYDLRNVILLLNVPNYLNNSLEKTFIATGVLLDNSRILTSYNPFRKLIGFSNLTDNILALLVTGVSRTVKQIRIANVVCGRQIAYVPYPQNEIWRDGLNSPLHDLMILRMDEEIGVSKMGRAWKVNKQNTDHFYFTGPLGYFMNAVTSYLAGPDDQIGTEVRICALGYRNKREMRNYDALITTSYEEEDAIVVDCEEWLPRQWGFFICIRNIDNFPGLGSSATLFSNHLLFGIGSFTVFKNDTSILVFTDVRPYVELIMKTCGDEEFT